MNGTVEVLQAPEFERSGIGAAPDDLPTRSRRHVLRALVATSLAAVLLFVVFPRVLGTTLGDVRAAFGAVSGRELLALCALWAAGLFAHSFVLTGSLPGLTRRRALTLNLTGSAVANTLPFGGAGGMSMNYLMIRAWGVEATGFAAFTLVTNAWGILLKLLMPTLAVAALWATGVRVSHTTGWTALAGLTALVLVIGAGAVALSSRRLAERAAGFATAIAAVVVRLLRRPGDHARVGVGVLACRDAVASVLRRSWRQISLGTAAYGVLQALLLWACLDVVGAHLAPAVVVAGYAVDRVMTLAVITPGAAGFVEAGTAAALIALGGAPAPVAAGVLLYRGFTFALEIPVGGVWLAGWLLQRRRATRTRAGL